MARNGLELRHLRYFVALGGHLHFGRAAEASGVSQPLLSRQIRELERLLGLRLVARTRPTVELTAAGRKFLEYAQETIQSLERAVRATHLANGGQEKLVIAFEPCSSFHGFTRLMGELRRELPELHLDVREFPVVEHVHRLRTGDIDIAYAHRNEDASDVDFTCLSSEPLLLVLPVGHWLARRKNFSLSVLADEPFLFWHRALAPACHDYILQILSAQGLDPRPKHRASDHRKSLQMVASGLGWTIAPACARQAGQRGVSCRNIPGVTATIEVGISCLRANGSRSLKAARKLWTELAT